MATARAATCPSSRRSCSSARSRRPPGPSCPTFWRGAGAHVPAHRRTVHHLCLHRAADPGHRLLRLQTPSRAQKMGITKSSSLTVALGALAAIGLLLGLWPLAALALAFLVGGRREPVAFAADAIVFVGLAGQADLLWVALLVVASLAAREHDPRAILILFFASLAAIVVYVDWTILTGLLAVLATIRAVFSARRVFRRA